MEKTFEEFININVDVPAEIIQKIEQYNKISKRPVYILDVIFRALEKEVAKIEAKTGDGRYFHKVNKVMLQMKDIPESEKYVFYQYFLKLLEDDGCPYYEKFAALPINEVTRLKFENCGSSCILFLGPDCGIQLRKEGVFEKYTDDGLQHHYEQRSCDGRIIGGKVTTYRRVHLETPLDHEKEIEMQDYRKAVYTEKETTS